MTKLEILENIVGMLHSSFIDDNYTSSTADQIYDDCVEYAIEQLDDYGIPYTEEEIRNYFQGKI
jgi:hypothetical protein